MKKLNSYRNIANEDDPIELLRFEHTVLRLIKRFGLQKVEEHFAQAAIDQHEARFMEQLQVKKGSYKLDRRGFTGDHVSLWEGANGTIFRADEYPMSWEQVVDRIQKYMTLGLDGYVTGQSIHYPGITFGLVAFEKGKYHTDPGI